MNKLTLLFLTAMTILSATPPTHGCKQLHCQLHSIISKRKTNPHLPVEQTAYSLNWSGYVAANNLSTPQPGSVSEVYGSWTVPSLKATSNNSYSATWVGIDGWSNGTVEQIGTSQNWIGGAQSNYAWFEIYPNGAYEIIGFPVHAGDVMGAEVLYLGSNTFELVLWNYTKGIYYVVPSSYTHAPSAERSSAEWIVEAPYNGGILPLSDFGATVFTNCTATINRIAGPISDSPWKNESVTMITQGFVVKDIPSALTNAGRNFSVTWQHE